MAQKGKPVEGQSCTVTEGPNKGKKGTYTVDDEGNIWCEGDWGGTQCGKEKCKDAKSQISVFEYTDANGQLVYEIDGLCEVEGKGIFHCRAMIDAVTGAGRNVAVIPIAATPLATLRESESDLDRIVANVIRSHVDSLGREYR